MGDLITEAIAAYNLPLTILLGLVLVYWMLVIIGALDLDFLHINFDMDHGGHLDGGLGHDIGHGVGHDVGHDAAHQGGSAGTGSVLGSVMGFINAGHVPIMLVFSILFVSMWIVSILTNYYLNPGEPGDRSQLIALGLLVPNFIVSVLITRYVTLPLRPLMKGLAEGEVHEPVIGREGVVTSAEVTRDFGRIEVETGGAPLLLNARISEGSARLTKGDSALIIDHDEEKDTYLVRKL